MRESWKDERELEIIRNTQFIKKYISNFFLFSN